MKNTVDIIQSFSIIALAAAVMLNAISIKSVIKIVRKILALITPETELEKTVVDNMFNS